MTGRTLPSLLAIAATTLLPLAAQTGARESGTTTVDSTTSATDSIRTMADLGADELLIIRFTSPGECGKCSLVMREALLCMQQALGEKKIKTMGAIRCERTIELQAYARRNRDQFQFFIRDDGTLSQRLEIDHAADLVVMQGDGSILVTGSTTDMEMFCREAISVLGVSRTRQRIDQ